VEYRPIAESRIRERRALPGLAALILLAAGLFRLLGTLHNPFWLDEAYSAFAADHGWRFLWTVVPRYETHPPFYYSLLHAWNLIWGNSLLASRALSVVCGLLTLPVLAFAAQETGRYLQIGRTWTLWLMMAALLMAALSPPLIAMAREVRPYPVLILAYSVAVWGFVRLAREARDGGSASSPSLPERLRYSSLALFFGGEAFTLWLHNLGPLYGFSLSLALLIQLIGQPLTMRDWIKAFGGQVLTGLVYLPGLLILMDQAPTWIHSTWLTFSFSDLPWRLSFLYNAPGHAEGLCAAALAVAGLFVVFRAASGWRMALGLLIVCTLPVALSLIVTLTVSPIFIVRTLTPVAAPMVLVLAASLAVPGRMRWAAMFLAAALAGQLAYFDFGQLKRPPEQDWYGTLRWLQPQWRDGDELWAYPNEGALPFHYAARDLGIAIVPRSVPTPVPTLVPIAGSWHPTGSRGVVSLPPAALRAIAQGPHARRVPTIWLMRLGANAYDVGDVFLKELSPGRHRVARWKSGPIDIIGLRRDDVPAAPPATATAAR
jgi:hypothetical protein